MIATLAILAVVSGPTPHGMVFSFDRFALYGPIDSVGRIYPLDKSERPPAAVGDAVEVALGDDPPEGDYVLRLPVDEAKLPVGARPAHVRVVAKALFGWDDVPARFKKGKDGHHSLYVYAETDHVYAVVLGAGAGLAPVDDLFGRELGRFRSWVEHAGGDDVTRNLDPDAIRRLGRVYHARFGRVRFLRSPVGGKASAVLDNLIAFFDAGPGRDVRALTLGDRVYLFDSHVVTDTDLRRRVLAHELWHVVQARRLKGGYYGAWVAGLLEHGLRAHPMEVEADSRATEALR